MRRAFGLFLTFILCFNVALAQVRYTIIPFLNKLIEVEGVFEFKGKLRVNFDKSFKSEIKTVESIFLEEYFTCFESSSNSNLIVRQNSSLGREA